MLPIPPKRPTEFRSDLEDVSGKKARSLCLGVSVGWFDTVRLVIFEIGL